MCKLRARVCGADAKMNKLRSNLLGFHRVVKDGDGR